VEPLRTDFTGYEGKYVAIEARDACDERFGILTSR
jgi:hypothetical protein